METKRQIFLSQLFARWQKQCA